MGILLLTTTIVVLNIRDKQPFELHAGTMRGNPETSRDRRKP
jgi:hypothetical protein